MSLPLGQAWINWESRRQYKRISFSPGRELPSDYYNQWRGFAVEAAEGECDLFLQFLAEVVCAHDPALFDYFIKWCARAVQEPWRPGYTAIVLRGLKGVGKTFSADHIGELFGDHYVTMASSDQLVGKFNAHFETAIFVLADEAFWAGDKAGESALKTLITSDKIRVEPKGIDSRNVQNYTHVMMASNSEWVVPASYDERRYCVMDVSEEHREDFPYFKAIEEEWQGGGREAFLHHLLTLDLSGFNVREVPQTEALADQKRLSLPPLERWFLDMLLAGRRDNLSTEAWPDWTEVGELYRNYSEYCETERVRYPLTRIAFGMALLKRLLPPPDSGKKSRRQKRGSEKMRLWGYEFPPLDECRKHFDKMMKSETDWGDDSAKMLPAPETRSAF